MCLRGVAEAAADSVVVVLVTEPAVDAVRSLEGACRLRFVAALEIA
jgi:hypothetical protein